MHSDGTAVVFYNTAVLSGGCRLLQTYGSNMAVRTELEQAEGILSQHAPPYGEGGCPAVVPLSAATRSGDRPHILPRLTLCL